MSEHARARDQPTNDEASRCPLCDQRLFGWITLPPGGAEASVGMPLADDAVGAERVIYRCESCGVALEHGREIDLEAEWQAVCRSGEEGRREIAIPNRASLQAWIGVEGWTGIDLFPGRLLLTGPSLELLAKRNGRRLVGLGTPPTWRAQGWMWQTLVNGLTFNPNFLREVRAGRLRAGGGRGGARFAIDAIVTVLAAPLVALASLPLELAASVARRGGQLHAQIAAPGTADDD